MLRAYQKGLLALRWDAPCLEKRLLQDAGRKPEVRAGQPSAGQPSAEQGPRALLGQAAAAFL